MSEAICARHPGVPSAFTCDRCGRFACEACAGGGGLCSECFVRASGGPSSALAKVGLALGVLGTFTLLPGVAALAVGVIERRRIAEGRAPPSGMPLARGAIMLGWLSATLLALMGMAWLARTMEG